MAIINPIEQNFTCNSCGKCCRRDWKVQVALDEVAAIEDTGAFKSLERSGYRPLKISQNEVRVGRDDDGACHFLHNNGCELHRELGSKAKPRACQLYPYLLVNSPDGYYLSLAFSCPSVLAGGGQALAQAIPAIKDVMTSSSSRRAREGPSLGRVALTQNREIEWSEYLSFEQTFLKCLSLQDPISFLLQSTASVVTQAHSRGEFVWQPGLSEPEILRLVKENFQLTVAAVIGALENPEEPLQREEMTLKLLQGEVVKSHLLGLELSILQDYKIADTDLQTIVGRYFENLLLGKRLISLGSLVSRLLTLAVALAVLLSYLRAHQKANSQDNGLAWAFELIENSLMRQGSAFGDVFSQSIQ